MRKTLIVLAGVSSLVFSSHSTLANDKILSATSAWSVQKLKAVDMKSACRIFSEFEEGVTLSIEAEQSQMKALRIIDANGQYVTGSLYAITLDIVPGYQAILKALAVTPQELVIDISQPDFMQAIQRGVILKASIEGHNYGFSLNNMADASRRLITCRESATAATQYAVPASSFQTATNDVVTQPAASQETNTPSQPASQKGIESVSQSVASETNAVNVTQPRTQGAIKQIFYPVPKELQALEAEQTVPGDMIEEEIPAADVFAEQAAAVPQEIIVDQETKEFVEQSGEVVDTTSLQEGQAAIEPIQTVTRVHTPKVRLQPRQNDNNAVDVAVPVQDAALELARPPVFDPPVEELDPQKNNLEEIPYKREEPIQESSPTLELASQNETTQTISLEETNVPEPNQRAQLSQHRDRVYTRPVVIPQIPDTEMPTKFDITNQKVAGSQSITETYEPKPVYNEQLETEIVRPLNDRANFSDNASGQTQENVNLESVPQMPALEELQAPAPQPKEEDIINDNAQPSEPVKAVEPKKAPRWVANTGDDLRTTIAAWSLKENVNLMWESSQQYKILAPVQLHSDFEHAIANILNQYSAVNPENMRPVGQLFVDPATSNKVLVIQDDQRQKAN